MVAKQSKKNWLQNDDVFLFVFEKRDLKDFANHRHEFSNVDRRQYFTNLGSILNAFEIDNFNFLNYIITFCSLNSSLVSTLF